MLLLLPPEKRRIGPKDAENHPRLPLHTVLSAALPSLVNEPDGVVEESVRLIGTSACMAALFGGGGRNWVEVTRAPGSPVTPPAKGKPALIDPRTEDPLNFIWLDMGSWRYTPKLDISPRALLRASFTIDVLQLNTRDELLRGRRRAFSGYLARLREFSGKADSWDAAGKQAFIEDFQAESYRTVWLEMLRQRKSLADLQQLLGAVPEALAW